MTGERSGILGFMLKLVIYGVIGVVAMSLVYPQFLDDPAGTIQQAQMEAKVLGEAVNAPPANTIDVREVERRVHTYVNRERAAHDLKPLSYDISLAQIARDYSTDMAERRFFSHYSPEGDAVSDRYEQAGYDCRVKDENEVYTGGENLAMTYIYRPVKMHGEREQYGSTDELAAGIVQGWMNSPGHRENLLRPYWQQEGIGVHITENYQVFATQNFC